MSISKLLTPNNMTEEIVSKLAHFLPTIINESKYTTKTIEPVTADKYRNNMYGLLRNHIGISEEHIAINILLNGYSNSSDYDAEVLEIKCVDPSWLEGAMNILIANEKKIASTVATIA